MNLFFCPRIGEDVPSFTARGQVMAQDGYRGEWRLPVLIVCNVLALLLILSWYTEAGRAFWAAPDAAVFYALNGTLAEGRAWQWFWAAANTRRFDIAMALVILVLYSFHVFSGNREQIVRRTASGLVVLVVAVLAIQVSGNLLDAGRAGPSTTLQPSILLSEIVTGFEFEDRSGDSFPGDRGIALIMFTTLLWFFGGRVYGLLMAALSLFMLLPRLVVGANWLTDHLVGAAFVSLVGLSWVLATPLHARLVQWFTPLVNRGYRQLERVLAFFGGGPDRVAPGLAQAPLNLSKGFCMGAADIIPGVSGGTMALILGIYERLLGAIRSFDTSWLGDVLRGRLAAAFARNDLLFLIPLGLGIVTAILFFTHVVPLPTLIVTHPELVYGLFFGLIVASIVILMGEVDRYGAREILVTAAGVLAGFAIVNLVPVDTPTATWFIFLCGFVAISAMLLPGISGSFILLILGKYAYIVNALGTLDIPVILTFVAGMVAGLAAFSRAILWLLRRYHQPTLLVIKGILIGSLWMIWPFQDRVFEIVRGNEKLVASTPVWPATLDATSFASFGLMLLGLALVLAIHRLAAR